MASSGCDQLNDVVSAQLPNLFMTVAHGDDCLVTTPFLLPDGELIRLWVSDEQDASFTVRDDGLAGNALFLGGIGPRVIATRLKAAAARHHLDDPEEEELSSRYVGIDLANGLVAVASAIVDASAILLSPQDRKTTKDFNRSIEQFFVRNGWRYDRTKFVEGRRRRRRRIDFVLDQGPRQLMLLTFQPGSERAAETRLDEITVTSDELSDLSATAMSTLAVLIDDRDDAVTKVTAEWLQTLNQLLPGRVVSWQSRTGIASFLGGSVSVRA